MAGTGDIIKSIFDPKASIPVTDKIEQAVLGFMEYGYFVSSQINQRGMMEQLDREYYSEADRDKLHKIAQALNKAGDKTKIQDMNIPLVMTHVESAVSYFQETFLTGYPIFGVASSVKYQEQAEMLEALFSDNQRRAGWASNLGKCYRDGLKYNLMAAKVMWDYKSVPNIVNDPSMPSGSKSTQEWWQGNVITHCDMYNVGLDTRVVPNEIHSRGEFVYHTELITRMEFKQMIVDWQQQKRPLKDVDKAMMSRPDGSGKFAFYWPSVNQQVFQEATGGGVNWMAWAQGQLSSPNGIQFPATYNRTWLYARILPSEFGMNVPAKNTPQIWAFCIINGQHVIYAERMSNYHNYLPIIIGQPHDDGLRYQSKSLAQNAVPFQNMASAMWNISIQAKRRMTTDRVLYDPSKVDPAQMNNPNPSAKIPIKPSAFGTPLNQVVYQFPYQDNTNGLIQEAAMVTQFADQMNGQNKAMQGQFVKGNKTQFEYNDVMTNSSARNRQLALTVEDTFHAPIKEILLTNSLQYQTMDELQKKSGEEPVNYDPVSVREGSYVFKIADGLLPKDKIISGDTWKAAVQTLSTAPQLGASYDIGGIFAYLLESEGADISEFKKPQQQVMFEQAQQQWSMAAQAAAKSGAQFSTPQPTPQQYGLNPDGTVMQQPDPGINDN